MALFKTFEMQIDDLLIFFLRPFRKVKFRKMQSLKDDVQTVDKNQRDDGDVNVQSADVKQEADN